VGDAQSGSPIPTHHDTGGVTGGFVSATDDYLGTQWYWKAPLKFSGHASWAYKRTLSFYLQQSSTVNQLDHPDVILEGQG
jgi:hypothetical protein